MATTQQQARGVAIPRVATHRPRESQLRRNLPGIALAMPFLVLYVLFLIVPILYGALMSLFDTSLVRPGLSSFVGFANYRELFNTPGFWSSLWHTVLFTLLSTPPLVILALALALFASRVARGRWFFRLAYFAPYVLPVSTVVLVWNWMYQPETGLIDTYLGKLGIGPVGWLSDPKVAMVSIVILTVWWTLGFNFILYLAGIQEIPRQLYEAASLDGAGPWAQMRRITIPLLGRTTTRVAVLQVIASLKVFDQIYLLTEGGPDFSTQPAVQFIYESGFTSYRVGYASAASMVLFVMILAVSLIWFALVRRQEKGV
jgi:multiple sugar transport system permease protein